VIVQPAGVILYPPPKEGAPWIVLIELGDGKRVHQYAETEEEARDKAAKVPSHIFRVPPFDKDDPSVD
jgi:hypothetical protein